MLISDKTADFDAFQRTKTNFAVDFRRGHKPREDRFTETEEIKERLFPFESVKVEEEGTRGVGDFRDMKSGFDSTNEVLGRQDDDMNKLFLFGSRNKAHVDNP